MREYGRVSDCTVVSMLKRVECSVNVVVYQGVRETEEFFSFEDVFFGDSLLVSVFVCWVVRVKWIVET